MCCNPCFYLGGSNLNFQVAMITVLCVSCQTQESYSLHSLHQTEAMLWNEITKMLWNACSVMLWNEIIKIH